MLFYWGIFGTSYPARQTHDEPEGGESPALCRLSHCTRALVSLCEELQSCITQFAGLFGIWKSKVQANFTTPSDTLPQYQQKKAGVQLQTLALCVLLSAFLLCLLEQPSLGQIMLSFRLLIFF